MVQRKFDNHVGCDESIYDHPTLYDVLFSDTCRRELDFLEAILRRYGGAGSASVFEPACGTGRLLWRLGKSGHRVVGLDLNPKAVAFCNRRLRRHGLPASAVVGEMTNFSLRELGRRKPFDLAFNLVSSFLHLTSEAAAREHFRVVAESLKPGGHYILGLHLLPRGEAFCATESWTVRHGTLLVESHLKRLELDRRRRLETVEFRIRATTPRRSYEVVDTFPLRTYSAAQMLATLEASPFEILETFDFDFDLRQPIRVDTRTEDVVFVLKKTDRRADIKSGKCAEFSK